MAQLFEAPDVSDSFFVTHHDNLGAALDRTSVLAARAATAPRSFLRVDDLTRSGRADRAADVAEDSDHLVVLLAKRVLVRDEHTRHEEVHQRAAGEADGHRDRE